MSLTMESSAAPLTFTSAEESTVEPVKLVCVSWMRSVLSHSDHIVLH